MKKLRINYTNLKYKFILLFVFTFLSKPLISNEILFDIQGNEFTDTEVILSILKEIPDTPNKESTNDIIRVLNDSDLFSDVQVKLIDNKYLIIVKEYASINKLYFKNNERLKDEDLQLIASQINFTKSNKSSINLFIKELKNTYESFGFSNVKIFSMTWLSEKLAEILPYRLARLYHHFETKYLSRFIPEQFYFHIITGQKDA